MAGAFQSNAFQNAAFQTDGVTPVIIQSSGGFEIASLWQRRRTAQDIRDERERFGIVLPRVQEIVTAVAQRQAADLRQDELQRREELARELELAGVQAQSTYFEMLAEYRQALIDEEIGARLAIVAENETRAMLLMLAAI